jgi:hypothetical protein
MTTYWRSLEVVAYRRVELRLRRLLLIVRGEVRRSDAEPLRRSSGCDASAEWFIAEVV